MQTRALCRTLTAVAAAVAIAVGTAACGSDAESSSSPSTSSTTEQTGTTTDQSGAPAPTAGAGAEASAENSAAESAVPMESDAAGSSAAGAGAAESGSAAGDSTAEDSAAGASSESPSSAAGGASGAAGQLTAPGTTLQLGEAATLPIGRVKTDEAVVKVTVDSIKPVAAADVKELGLGDDAKEYDLFYVEQTLELVSQKENQKNLETLGGQFFTAMAGDTGATDIILMSGFDKCKVAKLAEGKVGEKVTGCRIYGAPKGEKVTSMTYQPNNTPYDDFDGKPVVWKG